jgi:hypothetical protein
MSLLEEAEEDDQLPARDEFAGRLFSAATNFIESLGLEEVLLTTDKWEPKTREKYEPRLLNAQSEGQPVALVYRPCRFA